jgi:hypothetical protein
MGEVHLERFYKLDWWRLEQFWPGKSPLGIGRRARLRISKSPLSRRFFAFQKTIDLRGKNAFCHAKVVFTTNDE